MSSPRAQKNPFLALPPSLRTDLSRAAARLCHDVGKYLSRTARNLPPRLSEEDLAGTGALLGMLVCDLYGPAAVDRREERPAVRFLKLAAPLFLHIKDSRLTQAKSLLAEIEALSVRHGIRTLCASEVDILPDGSLDFENDVLARLDFVIGSVHSATSQSREQMTARLKIGRAHV